MKRNSLTTALLAGLAGAAGLASTAEAVNLNPDGLGQVLVYPYYTVNNNLSTLISVVNTTNKVKGVKVRFLEGKDSQEVLDFNLYLSPFDVWTGAVFTLSNTGGATLITADKSCTVPPIPAAGVPFRNTQYAQITPDNGGTSLSRTREGHLEMITMVDLLPGTLATDATHVNGVPVSCPALNTAWAPGGTWAVSNGSAQTTLPTSGIYGAGSIVDVANGHLQTYTADAIEGFYTNSTAPTALHSNPGTTLPSLKSADNGGGFAFSHVFQSNGTVVDSTWTAGTADAVTALYMHNAIFNEFVTDPALGATSDWVVNFPTKKFYVFDPGEAVAPFTQFFPDNGEACEPIGIEYWDREERIPGTPPGTTDFSPPVPGAPPGVPVLCWEAQIVTFNQALTFNNDGTSSPSAVYGSVLAQNINTLIGVPPAQTTAKTGHSKLSFDTDAGHELDSIDGDAYFGLPVTGFWSVNYVNVAAQFGVLANYSGSYRHRASRSISSVIIP
jgi:hypothetical protein